MNLEEVIELRSTLETQWGVARHEMEQALSFYELTFGVKVERGFTAYRPPTGPRLVDGACDHILVGNEVITVPPQSRTQEAQAQADKLERAYQALATRIDRNLPGALMKLIARNAMLFGLGVSKGPLWDDRVMEHPERLKGERKAEYQGRIKEWEAKRRDCFPLLFRLVDPRQVLFPLDIFPVPFVLETGSRSARYIQETYGVVLAGKQPQDSVSWTEYWDKEQRLFLADDIPVLPEGAEENLGGFIPFSIVFSGLGRPTTAVASGDGVSALRGLLHPIFQALTEEATLLSAVDTIIQIHAYPRYVLPEGAALRIHWEPGPGGFVKVPDDPNFKLQLLEMPRTLPDVYNRLQMLRQEIEQATFSGVLQGSPPPGVDTGYQTAILVGQARMKFGDLLGNLERERETMLGNIGRLIEALHESISISGQRGVSRGAETINGEDWKGHYEVNVTLSGVSPEEADRRAMLGLNLLRAGAISLETFLERYAMLPDTTGERKRMLIEKILASPEVMGLLSQEALRTWADQELLEKIEAAQGAQPGGPGGGAMMGQGEAMVGGGAGMPGLTPQVPGAPQPPAAQGSPESAALWLRRLQRLGGVASQTTPIGGPREEVR